MAQSCLFAFARQALSNCSIPGFAIGGSLQSAHSIYKMQITSQDISPSKEQGMPLSLGQYQSVLQVVCLESFFFAVDRALLE